MAEFIVLGIEADRKDKVREIQFTVQLSAPELWVLGLGNSQGEAIRIRQLATRRISLVSIN